MKEFPPIGTRVRWNKLTPNPYYRGATGVIVRRTCSDDGGRIFSVTVQVDDDSPVRPPLNPVDCKYPRYLDLLTPTEEEIAEAKAGLNRLLETHDGFS